MLRAARSTAPAASGVRLTTSKTVEDSDSDSISDASPRRATLLRRHADALNCAVILAVSVAVRFYRLSQPAGVVFDEYHFGKFVNRCAALPCRRAAWCSRVRSQGRLVRLVPTPHPRGVPACVLVRSYHQGDYFFDIHPPLGKLTLAFFGWLGCVDACNPHPSFPRFATRLFLHAA
jgi:hypothetical protein